MSLAEIHCFPLLINDNILGVLQLGCVTSLSKHETAVIEELAEGFSIALQLVLNIEKQTEIEQEIKNTE